MLVFLFLLLVSITSWSCQFQTREDVSRPPVEVNVLRPTNQNQMVTDSPWHDERKFSSNGFLEIININGNIEIESWDQEKVSVTAVVTHPQEVLANQKASFDVKGEFDVLKQTTTSAKVLVVAPENWIVNLKLKVPRLCSFTQLMTKKGNITLVGISGEAMVKIEKGNITVKNFEGPVIAETHEGSILFNGLKFYRRLDGKTNHGDVVVHFTKEEILNATFSGLAPAGVIHGPRYQELENIQWTSSEEERMIHGRWGRGQGQINLSTLRGNVVID